MSDIVLGLLIGVVAGVVVVYLLLRIAARMLIRRLEASIGDLEQAIEKHNEEKTIDCRVELHNDVFFVYNNDTNEFMAQGKDLPELRERIRARWSNMKVSVVAGEETALEKLRAQI